MKAKILKLLREQDGYVSGQELSERFGVSRTAVWKAIGQLKKEGYAIEAVKNRGYQLLEDEPGSMEEPYGFSELMSRLETAWAGRSLFFYESLDSTNVQAKLLADQGKAHGTVVVADMQTAGRGRRGRVWESPAGTNIYFTLVLKPEFEPIKASMLTLVMAHSVAGAIQKNLPDASIGVKWPNDIVLNGKKICGILTEMSIEMDAIHHVVIGVGINVGEQEFPEELEDKATSLAAEGYKGISRCSLLTDILACFEKDYQCFLQTEDLAGLKESYEELLINRGREVNVLDPKGEFRGVATGINDTGELLVEKEDGSLTTVYAGEVSVRGIYGYV